MKDHIIFIYMLIQNRLFPESALCHFSYVEQLWCWWFVLV